jgi:hypothetical protein
VTNINGLSNAISRELQLYLQEVNNNLEVAKEETAKKLVQDLKLISPKKKGDYKKGWRIKRARGKFIIHNKTEYHLTHLLEHGHAKRGGGRVQAQIHIAPAEDRALANYVEAVERQLR